MLIFYTIQEGWGSIYVGYTGSMTCCPIFMLTFKIAHIMQALEAENIIIEKHLAKCFDQSWYWIELNAILKGI